MIECWALDLGRLFAIYRSWTFFLFLGHKCHSALRAIAGMIRNHFRMDEAGVRLSLLMLIIVLATRAIESLP